MSDILGSGLRKPVSWYSVIELTYNVPVSGSAAPPCQFPPYGCISPVMPSLAIIGGVYIGPILYAFAILSASVLSSGVRSKSTGGLGGPNAGRLLGNGCVGEVLSPGTSDWGTGRSSIGHTGCPVIRSNTYAKPCLLSCVTALIRRPSTVRSNNTGEAGRS